MLERDFAPVLVTLIMMMIPIVWILTSHQRKMAEIIHGRHDQSNPNHDAVQSLATSVQRLSEDVQELKQIVAQQVITLDRSPQTSESELRAKMVR